MGTIFCQEIEIKECQRCNDLEEMLNEQLEYIKYLDRLRVLLLSNNLRLENKINEFYENDI